MSNDMAFNRPKGLKARTKAQTSRKELMGLTIEKYAFDKTVNRSFVFRSPLGIASSLKINLRS